MKIPRTSRWPTNIYSLSLLWSLLLGALLIYSLVLSFRALSTAITSWSSLSLDSRRTVSFPSCARLFTEPSSKRDPDGFRNSTRYECLKCGRGWESCFFASLLSTNEDWNKRRQLIGSTFCLALKKKKNWKEWYEKEILWENCINIIIVSRNFFPQREGEILWLTCLRSIWISILIKANYWHWSVFEMEVSSVQSITIMRIFFRGIGYLSKFIIHKLGGCRNLGVKVETVSSLEGWAVRGVFQVSSWPWKKIHGQQVPCSLL